ncbi:unnamed protein product [Cuscuta epithymum]|uniref:Uncharacterized protein n=1 Tax=Cuscuta epithymum TaxID=186058 RepID=A0AAV0FN02_9ASTE|nr:unnamed protein product [Cuscuta epithymum]
MAPKVFFFLLTSLLLFFHTFANKDGAKNVETSTTKNEPFKNQNLWHPRPWLKRGPHPPLPTGWGHWPHPHPPLPAGWAHKPHPPMPAGGWSRWPPHLPIRGSPFWPRYPGFRGGWRWLPHPPLPSKQSKTASTSEEKSHEVEALGFWHHPQFPRIGARPPMPKWPFPHPPMPHWPFPHPPLPSWLPKFKWPIALPPLPSGGSRWPWLPHHDGKGAEESKTMATKCSSTPAAVENCMKDGTFTFSDTKGYTFSTECCTLVAEIKDECIDGVYLPVIKHQCSIRT